MVPVLVLLFVALCFILRGDLFYVVPSIILFLCFSVLLALRLPRLAKRELILVLFVRLIDLRLFGFCLLPLPLAVWERLRFVIVARPGLFSYLFVYLKRKQWDERITTAVQFKPVYTRSNTFHRTFVFVDRLNIDAKTISIVTSGCRFSYIWPD